MKSNLPVGLCSDADSFLAEHEKKPEICECCGQDMPNQEVKIGKYEAPDGEKFDLNRHHLTDGRYADEYLQHTDIGAAVMFLGLQISDGTKIEWEGWEMEGYI